MTTLESVSALATAGGTLVLAVATFASVRSANRSARAAERALLAGLRPVLTTSRMDDPTQKVTFADQKWVRIDGGRGYAEVTDEAIYFVISLRNVGSGMAVLHGWRLEDGDPTHLTATPDPDQFHRLTRDIYIAPSDIGFWQGALRDRSDPEFAKARELIEGGGRIVVELLYGDHEGGQRVITLVSMLPITDGDGYLATVSRHWNIDRSDPR